ncbi:MAG: TraR/DksA C4-type zinc finger protein [Planctomycetales bacterium]|nr:TraR/DksA C4-type zinc finger protein [Planctomycetales bacterium]
MADRSTRLALRCPACGFYEACDLTEMRVWLYGVGRLRRAADPEPDIIVEMFKQSLDRFTCPECDAQLTLAPVDDANADFGDAKTCEQCRQPIPAARLAAVPGTSLCALCQEQVDRGQLTGEVEYCPHCGGVMTVAQSGRGITRYRMRCTDCGR